MKNKPANKQARASFSPKNQNSTAKRRQPCKSSRFGCSISQVSSLPNIFSDDLQICKVTEYNGNREEVGYGMTNGNVGRRGDEGSSEIVCDVWHFLSDRMGQNNEPAVCRLFE